jgi:undecaprenyl-diphosphatase
MAIVDAIILGVIQGITEFLPISSSGHAVIVREFLSIDATNALAFDGMLHLATAVAVVIYFWSDIWTLIQSVLRKLSRLPVNSKDLTLFYALCIATVPAVVFGLITEQFFNKDDQSIGLIAILLLAASIFLMYAEWRYYQRSNQGPISIKRGLQVGLFQVLALLPGFSRFGVTMAGGMLVGMSRIEAARFSFLLTIPIAGGVGSQKLLQLLQAGGIVDWMSVLIGCSVAIVTALFTIHFFLSFIKNHTLWPFIWYGVVLASLVGYISFIV